MRKALKLFAIVLLVVTSIALAQHGTFTALYAGEAAFLKGLFGGGFNLLIYINEIAFARYVITALSLLIVFFAGIVRLFTIKKRKNKRKAVRRSSGVVSNRSKAQSSPSRFTRV